MANTRASKETQMHRMIDQWSESGLSKKQYCEKNKIHKSVFFYWQKRFREERSLPDNTTGFLKVQVKQPAIQADLTIEYPNGVRLHVPQNTDMKTINYLIQLVR